MEGGHEEGEWGKREEAEEENEEIGDGRDI